MGVATRSILEGLRIGQILGEPIGRGLSQYFARQNQLEDQKTKEQQQLQDFARQIKLEQALGKVGGFSFPGVNKAEGDRPASIDALPVREGEPEQLDVISEGVLVDPTLAEQVQRKRSQQTIEDYLKMHPPTPEKFQAVPTDKGIVSFGTRSQSITPLEMGGEQLRPVPKTGTGGRGLTENAKTSILMRAGKAGVNPDDPKYRNETGAVDYGKIALDVGNNERTRVDQINAKKLETLPAEVKGKIGAYQAVQKDLMSLRETLEKVQASGTAPGAFDNAITVSLSESPTSFLGSLFHQGLQAVQGASSKEIEMVRAQVTASIGRAIAGAALTGTEKQNLVPFTPQAGDSFERIMEKAAGLENFLNNQIEGLSQPVVAGRTGMATPAQPTATGAQTPAAPKQISNRQEYDMLPSGSEYIGPDGKPARKK